jgi:transposase
MSGLLRSHHARPHTKFPAGPGGENLRKRYLVHVAGYNLGLIMRLLVGAGTPREFLAGASAHLLLLTTAAGTALVILILATDTEAAVLVVSFEP